MVLQISVRDNIPDGIAGLQIVKDRLAVDTQRVLNDAGFFIQAEIRKETDRVFDRPTPFTRRRWKLTRAMKSVNAFVLLEAPRGTESVLRHHIRGGLRPESIEPIFNGILPSGLQLVAARAAKKNRYGNVSRNDWRKLRQRLDGGKSGGEYRAFFGQPTPRSPLGIYEVEGKDDGQFLKLTAVAVDPGQYRRRFDPHRLADRLLTPQKWRQLFRPHLRRTIQKVQQVRGRR